MGRRSIRPKVLPRFDRLEARSLLSTAAGSPGSPVPAASSPAMIAVVDTGVDLNASDPVHYQGDSKYLDLTDAYDAVSGTYGQAAVADTAPGRSGTTTINNVALGIAAAVAAGGSPNVEIVPIRAYDPSAGFDPPYAVVNAIYHAIDFGARVIDVGYVGTQYSLDPGEQAQLDGALQYARTQGVAVVASAGNGFEGTSPVGLDIDQVGTYYGIYPADSHLANMLVVAATDGSGRLASTSNWGATHVDLGAPTSPAIGATASASGYVAGLAGVLAATRTDWSGIEVVNRIRQTVQADPSLAGKVTTGGVVSPTNALRAIYGVGASTALSDYEGDLKSDLVLYGDVPGEGYIFGEVSSTRGFDTTNPVTINNEGVSVGGNGSIPVPGRYFGGQVTEPALLTPELGANGLPDGKYDFSILGQDASGNYYVMTQVNGVGQVGDIPVAGAFTLDGRDDLAFYGLHNGLYDFEVLTSSSGFDPTKALYISNNGYSFGGPGDVPVVGDFFGDGVDSPAIYGPGYTSTGQPTGQYTFAALDSGSLNSQYHYTRGIYTPGFGGPGEIPIVGDYDGDGKDDLALFGNFGGTQGFAVLASSNGFNPYQFVFLSDNGASIGAPGDVPVSGDFFGDGVDDPAVYGPELGANGLPDGTYGLTAFDPGSLNAQYHYTKSLTIRDFGGQTAIPASAPPAVRAQKAAYV